MSSSQAIVNWLNALCIIIYIELTISLLIGQKRTVNFWNQPLWHHPQCSCRLYILMSRTLKVKGNHIMYDRGAWFLRVIMSSYHALCCLPSVKKHKHAFSFLFFSLVQCIIKQLSAFGFGWKPLSWPWLFWISQKPHPMIV